MLRGLDWFWASGCDVCGSVTANGALGLEILDLVFLQVTKWQPLYSISNLRYPMRPRS